MANTIQTYVGDGTSTIYTFNFDYIKKDFVTVLVDGGPAGFTLTETYTVTLDEAPENGAVIIIQRQTDTARLVDFVDGSVLVAKDLNLSALQALHIAAEAYDKAAGSLLIDQTGAYTAGFRRLADLGDPTEDRDAVTKEWAETAMSSQLAAATSEKTQAVTARQASETARDGSVVARSGSETARTGSEAARDASVAARDAAQGHATTAGTHASTATTKASEAASSASTATTQAGIATTQAGISTTKATEAANSAQIAVDAAAALTREIYVSTAAPSGGADGDIWFQY